MTVNELAEILAKFEGDDREKDVICCIEDRSPVTYNVVSTEVSEDCFALNIQEDNP